MGFGLVIRFIELLQTVTTSKACALTVLHTSQITIGYTGSSQSVIIFTSCCLVVAFNSRHSPRPQLPAANSNSSQWLNRSSSLTNRLINCNKSKSKLCYDGRSVGKSVLVSSTHLGPKTTFLLVSDSFRFVHVGCRFWWQEGSVIYNCCCPHQHSHSQVRIRATLQQVVYCQSVFLGARPLEDHDQRFLFSNEALRS
jgi:hypothetical protein